MHSQTRRVAPMARTGPNPPAEKRVQVVVEPEQKRLYLIAAEVTGRTLSGWVRYHLDRAMEEDIRMSRQHTETVQGIKGEVRSMEGKR